uniref:Uncharacterized protein n=1 Tax=Rhipicephalus pulchellus TaxID=72859 RepID=L7M119_RHIPC
MFQCFLQQHFCHLAYSCTLVSYVFCCVIFEAVFVASSFAALCFFLTFVNICPLVILLHRITFVLRLLRSYYICITLVGLTTCFIIFALQSKTNVIVTIGVVMRLKLFVTRCCFSAFVFLECVLRSSILPCKVLFFCGLQSKSQYCHHHAYLHS